MEMQGEREGSLVDALSRVMEAGQRVLVDRVELVLAEARGALYASLGELTLGGFAVFFLLLPGWLAALALAAVWLGARWSLEASLAALSLAQIGLGIALLAWVARRRAGPPIRRETPP
jgi:hypothetical protein